MIIEGEIKCAGDSPEAVCRQLIGIIGQDAEIVTIYYGNGTSAAAADDLRNVAAKMLPDCDVSLYDGGQPVYFYIVSAE